MGSFSRLGIGLSFLFGCILIGLVGELYYLHWKKRISKSSKQGQMMFPFPKMQSFLQSPSTNIQQQPDLEMGSPSDKLEDDLIKLENFIGSHLFTIVEETVEDLELSSRKESRTGSLSEISSFDTPFLTPLSSPAMKAPSAFFMDAYNHYKFNPLFEQVTAELSQLRASPLPTFQFLKDAEGKLLRKLLAQECEMRQSQALKNEGPSITQPRASHLLPLPTSPRQLPFVQEIS